MVANVGEPIGAEAEDEPSDDASPSVLGQMGDQEVCPEGGHNEGEEVKQIVGQDGTP